MSDSLVQVVIDQQVAVVTLNRPSALNALNAEMRGQLVAALLALQLNDDVRVIVLTGSGRAFCAGLDLSELKASGDEVEKNGIVGRELLEALDSITCPVIAAVNGYAITGGFELALRCDLILASHDAVFADTHALVGIIPAWGISQILPQIIGPMRAKEMSLSGNKIDAQLAYQWGLVNHVYEPGELLAAACALGRNMAACDQPAQQAIKTLIDQGWRSPIEDGLLREQKASAEAFKRFAETQKAL